ncbi:MAG: formyl transferase [Luminiphilus sp.]
MNISILYNYDIYSNEALNLLLPELSSHQLSLFYSKAVGKSVVRDRRLEQLRFVEQGLFNDVLYPVTDSGDLRAQRLSFEQLGKLVGAPPQAMTNINSEEGLAQLRATQPDLILSIRFGQILKDEAISTPQMGVINLHSGLLPAYRGVMASFWAMLNQAPEIGTTVHWITDPKIDAGHKISEQSHAPNLSASYMSNVLSLYESGVEQLIDAVANLDTLRLDLKSDMQGGDYYSYPTTADLDWFEEQGLRLFDPEDLQILVQQRLTI